MSPEVHSTPELPSPRRKSVEFDVLSQRKMTALSAAVLPESVTLVRVSAVNVKYDGNTDQVAAPPAEFAFRLKPVDVKAESWRYRP